jgi:hypothetical protein
LILLISSWKAWLFGTSLFCKTSLVFISLQLAPMNAPVLPLSRQCVGTEKFL